MKRIILYGIILAFTIQVNAKTSFRTERLKTIAGMVKLNVPDSLEKHLTIDSLGRYKNKPVKLKTNSFGDVSHIGYKLFNGRTDGTHDPMMPFFDFIERYFLELDLELDGKKPAERIFLDKVDCIRGNIAMRHKVTDQTGFSIKHVGRRAYTIQWVLDKDTLELFVPADCQLILGANAVELETIFERDLKRVVPSAFDCDWAEEDVSLSDDGLSVANPGSYLSDEIKFVLNVPVDPEELDEKGFLRYVRNRDEEPVYKIVGESFIVPRSYMGYRDKDDNYKNIWGTGEYKLEIELKETCDVTEQYRENWKKDRKRRKKLMEKESIWENGWQTISNQRWDELAQSWVITTLQAPAGIITKDVIDKLGLAPE